MEAKVKVGDLVNNTWGDKAERGIPYLVIDKLVPEPRGEVDWMPKHGKVIVSNVSSGATKVVWEEGLLVLSSSAD
jgi:hypothetical protein